MRDKSVKDVPVVSSGGDAIAVDALAGGEQEVPSRHPLSEQKTIATHITERMCSRHVEIPASVTTPRGCTEL